MTDSTQEEKTRRATELAEQASLPYKWTQSIRDVDVTIPVAGHLRGKDLDVVLAKDRILVGVRGEEPIIDVFLSFVPGPGWYWTRRDLLTEMARAPSHIQSSWTSPPGHWRQHPRPPARKSPCTWIK